MDAATSLRWALYHRALSFGVALLGGGLAAIGLWLGLYDVLTTWWANWPDISSAPLTTVSGGGGLLVFLVGIGIWWIGATAVSHHVRMAILEATFAEWYDTERVKSELLSVLDGRLEEIHDDLDRIRIQREPVDDSDAERWHDDRLEHPTEPPDE